MPGTEERDTRALSQEKQQAFNEVVAITVHETTIKIRKVLQAPVNGPAAIPVTVAAKRSSGATGLSAMVKFDWTSDKGIYQQWELWSKQTRHALNTMKGDTEATKINCFNIRINNDGLEKIESWKNKGILIPRKDYDKLS